MALVVGAWPGACQYSNSRWQQMAAYAIGQFPQNGAVGLMLLQQKRKGNTELAHGYCRKREGPSLVPSEK